MEPAEADQAEWMLFKRPSGFDEESCRWRNAVNRGLSASFAEARCCSFKRSLTTNFASSSSSSSARLNALRLPSVSKASLSGTWVAAHP